MDLPDQMTVEELEEKIQSYKERLDQLPGPSETPVLKTVRGGQVEEQAMGAARVSAAGKTLVSVPGLVPHVELRYHLPGGPGPFLLETTPARLLKVGSNWREEALQMAGWRNRRVVDVSGQSARLTFQVPGIELTIAAPTRHEQAAAANRYEVPPAATHIRGEGTLIYPTGQEIKISGKEVLKRPGPGGELTVRPGGVYAFFEGPEPAEAKLGNKWIPTTPTR